MTEKINSEQIHRQKSGKETHGDRNIVYAMSFANTHIDQDEFMNDILQITRCKKVLNGVVRGLAAKPLHIGV